ncbi:MAG: Na/Pi cotransporter family protein [Betaproteobacteria bacterium]|nr:MAG: Na/Pi cotransporter family protein [Betaproteobacteria bacterium]
MEFGLVDLLTLLGALGFFIYGMKVMSEGIQKIAGERLRQILAAMTQNRFLGVFTGFLITGLVQSSSATTVMTVSFVNAGLLSLMQSAGVMMGANIGTTVTAWFLAILGFKVKIASIALPVIAFGIPLMFFKKQKLKNYGELLVGFALLFLGLDELKSAVPDLKSNPEVLNFVATFTDMGWFTSRLIFIGIGTLLTIIIQSSSAAMALTLVMCNEGWIPFEMGAAMVLGENIGTTITAELASLVGNVHAKRSARIHSMFNIIGVSWMFFMLPYYLIVIEKIMLASGIGDPFTNAESVPIALSYFHTAFNLSNVLLLIGFVPLLVKLAIKLIPARSDEDEEFHLEYIGTEIMRTADLSLEEARKEVAKFGKTTSKMSRFLQNLLKEEREDKQLKLLERIKRYEEVTDRMEEEIANYLVKVSEGRLSEGASIRMRSILSISNDLESAADRFYQISEHLARKARKGIVFTDEQNEQLQNIFNMVDEALNIMLENLNNEYQKVLIDKAFKKEMEINKFRNKMRKAHLKSIERKEYSLKSGITYNEIFLLLERAANHILNVTRAITGEVSKDDEDEPMPQAAMDR